MRSLGIVLLLLLLSACAPKQQCNACCGFNSSCVSPVSNTDIVLTSATAAVIIYAFTMVIVRNWDDE